MCPSKSTGNDTPYMVTSSSHAAWDAKPWFGCRVSRHQLISERNTRKSGFYLLPFLVTKEHSMDTLSIAAVHKPGWVSSKLQQNLSVHGTAVSAHKTAQYGRLTIRHL